MTTEGNYILSVNAGSSSIKLDLFRIAVPNGPEISHTHKASVTGIGQPVAVLTVTELPLMTSSRQLVVNDQASAVTVLIQWLNSTIAAGTVQAIGHRFVHGGPDHSQPERITAELEQTLQSFTSFDPEHTPAALQLVTSLRQQYLNVPQFVSYDTNFFSNLPPQAQRLALPRKYEAIGLRRYGFHGLSYSFIMSAFRELAGETAANGRIVAAHLGSGASLAAIHQGQPIDTTMSFTPASGILMSSRSGDLDPGIGGYLQKQTGMSSDEYTRMVNFESGLLGVSGLSADMYTLLQHESTNPDAAEAIELFVYQVRKSIGALTAALGGIDSLIFSGGIGEHSAVLRQRIVSGLEYLGIALDESANETNADLISASFSKVGVHVLATDEASVIAQDVLDKLIASKAQGDFTVWN